MFSEKVINKITNQYLKELKADGRKFNPIKVKIKSRKSVTNFGKAKHKFEKLGYDEIEINQYIVNEEELRNTILHELAHLDLYARGNKHGSRWQQVAGIYGRKYSMDISRVSCKEIKVPGQVVVKVEWADSFYKYNPKWERGKLYERTYSSIAYANNFIDRYKSLIKNVELVKG